jgi:diacylglycerol kinase family enzyme
MSGPRAGGRTARVALLINPRATCSTPSVRARVAHELAPLGVEWTLVTRTPADTGQMAAQAVGEGAEVVVTLGGDGTHADVAAVLAGTGASLAPLPGGNANVFSRALGWPADIDAALAALPGALVAGAPRTVHLGRVRAEGLDHTFIVNCGVGLDAATVEWIERRPRTKRHMRHAGYAVSMSLATLRSSRADAGPLSVHPERGGDLTAGTLLAACGSPYAYLNSRPLDLVPGADFDGTLRWSALRRVCTREVAWVVARAVRGRPVPVEDRDVVIGDVGARLRVSADEPVPVQADGEPLGRHREIIISPGPLLRVVVPGPPAS